MKTSDFDYILPSERIAQEPMRPRDHSRLLVLNRKTGEIDHRHFYELGEFLRPGDLLVVNESKVFKARLMTTEGIEIFLLRPEDREWVALAKPGKKLHVGDELVFADGTKVRLTEKRNDGTITIIFDKPLEEMLAWTDRVGSVPTPPYVDASLSTASDYQTVYAKSVGSVAAPTAGFHFTSELIAKLKAQGIRMATVTLHVGLGTFRPIKAEKLEEHIMHEEWVDVPDETMRLIEETKKNGGRVVAVGTTTVRALESGARHGFTNVFITPGYKFKYIDALITNFHLPKSTLLVLVSSFAGRDLVLRAYQEAIKEKYRFYSFGDAMLIL